MVSGIQYTATPQSVLFMSQKRGTKGQEAFHMIPVPVLEYTLKKNNSDSPDSLTFECPLDNFPTDLFTEMFIADARSGRYVVELYTGYFEDIDTYVIDNNGENIYNPELITQIKQEKYLRFYGLANGPELKTGLNGNTVNFSAYDISFYFRENKIVTLFSDKTCVEIIEHIVSKTPFISNVKYTPKVDRTQKMGQKGNKDGHKYIARNVSYWDVIRDAAKRIGEEVRVKKREIQIGRFTPIVNRFEYYYGAEPTTNDNTKLEYSSTMDNVSLKKQPMLDEEDIQVEVYLYDNELKWTQKGFAGQFQSQMIDQLNKTVNSSNSSTSDDGLKQINVKTFRFYFTDREGDLDQLAKDILLNIIYKRWNLSFTTVGNPVAEIDDIVGIHNFFGGNDFEKIKWRISEITESFEVKDGYTTDFQCEGVLLEDIAGLEREKEYQIVGSSVPFPEDSSSSSSGGNSGGSSSGGGNGFVTPKQVSDLKKLIENGTIKGTNAQKLADLADRSKGAKYGQNNCAFYVSNLVSYILNKEYRDDSVSNLYTNLRANYAYDVTASNAYKPGDIFIHNGVHTGIMGNNGRIYNVSSSKHYIISDTYSIPEFRKDSGNKFRVLRLKD